MSPWSSFIALSMLWLQFTHCISATATILYYRHKCHHVQFRIRLQVIKFYFPYMETNYRLIGLNLDCDGTRRTMYISSCSDIRTVQHNSKLTFECRDSHVSTDFLSKLTSKLCITYLSRFVELPLFEWLV